MGSEKQKPSKKDKRMKTLKITLAALAATLMACAFVPQANAAMINGAITFSGGATYDTMSLATATRVNNFSDVVVQSNEGDFSSVAVGTSVTMGSPWVFSPSTSTPGLWSVGGFTYDLTSATVVFQSSDFLAITGTGTISGNGFDATPGVWNFSSQTPSANGIFSFSAGTASQGGVPDSGTTVALLGLGLAGVELIRRRLLRTA
jgi:hypothetical protein